MADVIEQAARLMANNNRAVWDDPRAREYFLSDARALAEAGLLADGTAQAELESKRDRLADALGYPRQQPFSDKPRDFDYLISCAETIQDSYKAAKARIEAALKLCDLPWGCFVDRPEVQIRIRAALTAKWDAAHPDSNPQNGDRHE